MDLERFPYPIDVVWIAAGESVERGSVFGIDDKKASDGRFAVVGDQSAGGEHRDPVFSSLVQMDSMLAIEFGACGQNVCFVDSVNDELHRKPPAGGSVYCGTCVPRGRGLKASKLAPPEPSSVFSQERAVAERRRRAGAVLGLHSTTWLPFCIGRDRT
ncbi:MAG: hypothetical protein WAL48_16370, partial [Xanthobacteraceae bacterium]